MKILFPTMAFALMGIMSCKKFLDIPFPQDQVSSVAVFSDDSTAQSAVLGLYGQLMTTASIFLNGSLTIYPGLSSDELYNTSPQATQDQFYSNALSPDESSQIYNGLWKWAYADIFHCNNIIKGLDESSKVSLALKNQLKGEALAVRALCYFYLTNLYGDVPLQTSIDYTINNTVPRTDSRIVYEQIVKDLKDARDLLIQSAIPTARGRFNAFAATALLARVYLYQKEYTLAEEAASDVLSQPAYSLSNDLSKIFLIGSGEAILQLYPVALNQNTGDGFALIPPGGAAVRPPFAISSSLLNAFEPGDKRKAEWTKGKTIGSETFIYPFKYKVKSGPVVSEGNTILRLGEQYLIRAESRAMLNNFQGALDDLNLIRQRAGLPSLAIQVAD